MLQLQLGPPIRTAIFNQKKKWDKVSMQYEGDTNVLDKADLQNYVHV